ncbi:MAG: hypothetical protein QXM31_02945 [Candidatus Woesearchaeota archaeon]
MRQVKSQMEIMGLAIIVILVTLGILFAIAWLLQAPSSGPVEHEEDAILAANFISAALGTTTDCNKRTVRELLQDCAVTQGATKCGQQTSCDYARDVIQALLDNTLKVWKKDYYLAMTGTSALEEMRFGSSCKGEKEMKEQPLPVTPAFKISVLLEICR